MLRDLADFDKKGLDPDVVLMRFKHHQQRLLDSVSRLIRERAHVKETWERRQPLHPSEMGHLIRTPLKSVKESSPLL